MAKSEHHPSPGAVIDVRAREAALGEARLVDVVESNGGEEVSADSEAIACQN